MAGMGCIVGMLEGAGVLKGRGGDWYEGWDDGGCTTAGEVGVCLGVGKMLRVAQSGTRSIAQMDILSRARMHIYIRLLVLVFFLSAARL